MTTPNDDLRRVEKNIYQRGPYSYQVKMMVQGRKIVETFDCLEEARAFRDTKSVGKSLDPDFVRVLDARVKKREAAQFTLSEALDRYQEEVTAIKKSASSERTRIAKLKRYPIASVSFYALSPDDVIALFKTLKGEGLTDNSCRKYGALISHCFTIAMKRWRLKVTNPIKQIELPSNGKPRKRRLEDGEAERLYAELNKARNPYASAAVQLAVETAMRQGELLGLRWEDVHLYEDGTGTAELHDTKNGESRVVPLSTRAVAVLRSIPRNIAGEVFSIKKEALRSAWEAATARAGIEDLRFHDLRHEATSRLFELGLDKIEAASITGHKTLQMLKDYTHLSAKKLARKLG